MSNPAYSLDDAFSEVKRGVGRPKGITVATTGAGRIRYRPKKWLPEFNQLVIDYIVIPGVTHEELGDKYGYTKVQICNILSSPQARDIQEAMARGILTHNAENSLVKLGEMSKKITERLHSFIHNDSLYNASPFAFVDKSLSIGKAIGVLSEGKASTNVGGTTVNNSQTNIIAISGKDAKELGDSLALANKLRVESGAK